jgi:hypothetical protein
MSDHEATNPDGTNPDGPSEMSVEPVAESPVAGDAVPMSRPPAPPPDWPTSVSSAQRVRWPRVRGLLSKRSSRWIAAVVLVCSMIGVTVGLATSSSATAPSPSAPAGQLVSGTGVAGGHASGGGGSNARSGPASGGASGTVNSVSTTSFTITTSAGQDVTVDEASSTAYKKGPSSASATAVTKGETVLVLGTTDNTTIAATQVIVQPTGGSSGTSGAVKVVPFQRGTPTTSKQVGQIPASYSEGTGTIVSGTTANKATEAALAAYPGGVVDRVVELGNGEYEVHYFGVNWPHHVFVNQNFKVVGAE